MKIRNQFRWQNFRVTYDEPDDFILHQWQVTTHTEGFYVLYRFVILASLTITFYLLIRSSLWLDLPAWKRFVYFTNWMVMACFMDALLVMLIVLINYAHQLEKQNEHLLYDCRFLIKFDWVMNIIAVDCSAAVVLSFWTMIYVLGIDVDLGSKIYHTVIPLVVMNDFWVRSVPVRILHGYITLFFGMTYVAFCYVFQVAGLKNFEGDPYVYKATDWRSPGMAVMYCISALALSVVVHVGVFGLYYLKNLVCMWLFKDGKGVIEGYRSSFSEFRSSVVDRF